jgi:shikimate dehydrogenase
MPSEDGTVAEMSKAACVIGWPVEHSRSPLVHNHWIRELGLAAEYRREAVPPEQFAEFVSRLAKRGYVGANVTVPHKESALALADPDARALAVGAATLWYEGGALRATNTDVEGFVANLDAAVPDWDHGLDTAVVLGAGGAARAVVFALVERSAARIAVVNRSFDRARRYAAGLGNGSIRCAGRRRGASSPAPAFVNTTTLGMAGNRRPTSTSAGCPRARWSPISSMCRSKLRCSRPPGRADYAQSTGSGCSCTRRSGVCPLVWRAPAGDGGLARPGGG